tara:strand:- start:447 stop:1037 length:591 start_codon:yes stop_codon:yes gene_type:complete
VRLNKIVRKIHTYIGLQAVVSLLLFSIAVIAVSIDTEKKAEFSYHQFEGDLSLKNIELAKLLRKQIGLRFEPEPREWMISEEIKGNLVVRLKSPVGKREVTLNKVNGNIEVKSWPFSVSHFANHMHQEGFWRRKPSDSLWLWAWSLYIEFSILALFALPVTGFYIWVSKKSPKEFWALSSLLFSSATMTVLWVLIR